MPRLYESFKGGELVKVETKLELRKKIRDLQKELDGYTKGYSKHLIKQRDRYMCRICGDTEFLEVHHLTPSHLGGDNSQINLITLCCSCHLFMHCNPKIVMKHKMQHSENTKNGQKNALNIGKRGKDKKPRKKIGYSMRYK